MKNAVFIFHYLHSNPSCIVEKLACKPYNFIFYFYYHFWSNIMLVLKQNRSTGLDIIGQNVKANDHGYCFFPIDLYVVSLRELRISMAIIIFKK